MNKANSPLKSEAPLISPEMKLPEITLKAIIVSMILCALLAASNAYLALKVGMTVAASIPAAVISMGIFRFFKKSNILESNLVQTAASAGEGLAGQLTFILPALLIVGYWSGFNFWITSFISLLGGTLGVMFAVLLRKILLNLNLPFPEGTAIGNVLKAQATASNQMKNLIQGSAVGGIIAFCQTGLQFMADHLSLWFRVDNLLWGLGVGFDPVLIGAGYIIGIRIVPAFLVGMVSAWVIGIPILSYHYGLPASGGSTEDMVMALWNQHIRYIGAGCMLVAGLWTLLTLLKPMLSGMRSGFASMRDVSNNKKNILRTEKDIPFLYVLTGISLVSVFTFCLMYYLIATSSLGFTTDTIIFLSFLSVIILLVFGYLSSVMVGYIVGIIGSTNAPVSGILIINILLLSVIILPLIRLNADLNVIAHQHSAIAIIIFIAALVGTAAIITDENIQDLKAGAMIGATPWKQQGMMLFGVVLASFIVAPIMQLLFQAYGMGGVFPHPGMSADHMLPAPQAGLMAALAQAAVGKGAPWDMLAIGGLIAVICIIIDFFLKKTGIRLVVFAVGLGIYLPPTMISAVIIGGLINYFASRVLHRRRSRDKNIPSEQAQPNVLLACGLIAGSSLMGVILAIPFVISGNSNILRIVSDKFQTNGNIIGTIVFIAVCIWMYKKACKE